MGLYHQLRDNSSTFHLRTKEDIDLLFSELKKQKAAIDNNLDFKIRMSIQQVKLQLYYELKLTEYRRTVNSSKKLSNDILNNREPDGNSTRKEQHKEKAKPSVPTEEKLKEKVKKSKAKKKKIKEDICTLPKKAGNTKEISHRFSSFREIDAIVNYFKGNSSDLNAVTEDWIRKNIHSTELLEYYKNRMQHEVGTYRSVVYRMLYMSRVAAKERRKLRIERFKEKITAFIDSRRDEKTAPKRMEETSFDALKKKEWILDWNCVMFKRGHIVIYARQDLGLKFSPTEVSVPKSIESFNYIKKYLNERLSPVRCEIVGLKLSIIDKINFDEAIQQFAIASRQNLIRTSGRGMGLGSGPTPMSFNQALSKAKQMTPEEFKKYKSAYIDFLVTLQSMKFKVIPCVERLAHTNSDTTEYAFMFSVECRSGKILIVHENVNPDRSTLLFLVREAEFNKSIREIYDFLQSAEINKRSSLRDRSIEVKNAGIESYRSINHDDLYSWKSTIMLYKNYR